MDDEGWERRMAERAAARRAVREAEQIAKDAADDRVRQTAIAELLPGSETWLHGWPTMGDGSWVLIGTAIHCTGCGQFQGVTCVAFDDGWTPPDSLPDWPYSEADCPIHRAEL